MPGEEGAAGGEGRTSSGASDGEVDEEGAIGAAGMGGSFCCVKDDGVLLGPAAFPVLCDAFFDFFAFARIGE